ncbi:MAG: hypothetical protein JSV33_13595 [bacterium]|nr:MAG: hypothetical protein JSV33_13595 [bacterium]
MDSTTEGISAEMTLLFNRLICERRAANDPLTKRIISRYPGLPVEMIECGRTLLAGSPSRNGSVPSGPPPRDGSPLTEPPSRNSSLFTEPPSRDGSLLLMHHPGSFVKDFPAGPDTPPCGEKYIVTMQNCPFTCSYCYLQCYLAHRHMVLFTNVDEMKGEVRRALESENPPRVLTTGEFGDSLVIDHLTGTTKELLPLVHGTMIRLEARTKSANIDHLLESAPHPNLIVTWTLGPETAILNEEPRTATLDDRLSALARTAAAGIMVGVRFDPIIPAYAHTGAYREIIERLAADIDEEAIFRFELGVLRFPPGLWQEVRARNPRSVLLHGEYLKNRTGKMRLYRPSRVRLYRDIAGVIREVFGRVPIELSMEDRTVWEDAGIEPPVVSSST